MAAFNLCGQCSHPAHLPEPCGGGCRCEVAELPGVKADALRRLEARERAHQRRAQEMAERLNRILVERPLVERNGKE